MNGQPDAKDADPLAAHSDPSAADISHRSAEPIQTAGSPGASDEQAVLRSLDGLFAVHEVRVLGIVGLLTGYICILLVKMIHFESPVFGIFGIVLITLLLLLLDPRLKLRSIQWWSRAIVVLVISAIITSPQLYNAWTVAVNEARAAELANLAMRAATTSLPAPVKGTGTISSRPQ